MIYHKEVSYMKNEEINEQIIKLLESIDWPITTEQVAKQLNLSWNTAQVHLLKMLHEGIVKYKKVGRQNQFWLNEGYEKYFKGDKK